ncbi:MAG: hypothetical protein ACYSWU_15400, partial [Planctomycetota bacterium]
MQSRPLLEDQSRYATESLAGRRDATAFSASNGTDPSSSFARDQHLALGHQLVQGLLHMGG